MTGPPVHVVWWTGHVEVKARTFWDQQIVYELLDRSRHHLVQHDDIAQVPAGEGAVVLVPARFQDGDAGPLNVALAPLPWVLLVLTSDEEGAFPFEDVQHPNLVSWVQSARPGRHDSARRLPLGPTTDTRFDPADGDDRPLDWFFAGQITHQRRVSAARAMVGHDNGLLLASSRFGGGFDQTTYLHHLASSKIVLAPSGPVHPDTFRLWEALEACALPLVDARASHYSPDQPYWPWLLGEDPPFPIIEDWDAIADVVTDTVAGWPSNATRAAVWWQQYKRRLARTFDHDITTATGHAPQAQRISDLITVIVTTSPIPSHPATDILDTTIDSVRAQPQLLEAEVLVAADGVHPDLQHRAGDYARFLHRLAWQASTGRHGNLLPLLAPEWRHQALTVAAALEHVDTPLVLVMEHDTPLVGDIDWDGLGKALLSSQAHVIRLHHEAGILPDHEYLMIDEAPETVCGVPLLRTAQWSQRPHLASTDFYRSLLSTYFGPDARTMIEDCVFGVVANAYDQEGVDGWDQFRVWIYAPDGDMKRSTHLDGRAGDPKGEMRFEYPPGGTPRWAPRAMSERTVA